MQKRKKNILSLLLSTIYEKLHDIEALEVLSVLYTVFDIWYGMLYVCNGGSQVVKLLHHLEVYCKTNFV